MKQNTAPLAQLKVLFISKWAEGLDIAYSILQEGHAVKMFIEEKSCREIGYGFVPKVRDWKKHIDWADYILFDYTGYGKIADELRSKGYKVFGGSEYTDQLELDRNFGQNELRRHQVRTLEYLEFSSTTDAILHIKKFPNKYVIKPCGELSEFKQLLYVGQDEDGSDVIRILKAYEKTWGKELGTFQIQRKVSGVEVAISAFFNGKNFIKPINVNFEHKKLFPRELGVSTGEMGTSMFWSDNNPIFDATLKKFEQTLAHHGYVGHIDINCIVNGNGIFPLEFTSRFGYPQVQIQRAGITENLGHFFYKLTKGEQFTLRTKKGFQIGVNMVVPPFPYDDKKTFEVFSKDAVVVFKKKTKEGVHPMHVKCIDGEWLVTGDSGLVLVVTGTGTTMKEAQKQMYNRVSTILINNSYYRTDIGDRWAKDFDRLWTWKLL